MCVCDYQFNDEDLSEVTDRLKEMLDIDAAEEDLDNTQEMPSELTEEDDVEGRRAEFVSKCLHHLVWFYCFLEYVCMGHGLSTTGLFVYHKFKSNQ